VIRALFVLGTRPEAIKLAPVIRECKQRAEIDVTVCSTGQHKEMLSQALAAFDLTPDVELSIMKDSQTLVDLTASAIKETSRIIAEYAPEVVIVQGDTTTAMSAALAAFYDQISVMHIEAGLRTYDKYSPFPEEINRVFIDNIADHCMAPTETAAINLKNSGVHQSKIEVTGNTAIDALLSISKTLKSGAAPATLPVALQNSIESGKQVVTVTGHRRESFGDDFEQICLALQDIVNDNPDVMIAYPVHLNPRVQEPVARILGTTDRIHLFDPLSYPDFVWLLMNSHVVLTDSGGVQEEVPSLNKPVLVMRKVTERPEGIEAGCAKLVGVDRASIVNGTKELLTNKAVYKRMAESPNPYGNGTASKIIADRLERIQQAIAIA
jgi:UDP-N-acetylglucosamine 2-epimerase (non-hydrolysing)